ncbi:hypothetical protein MMC07_005669 [Pseudocyphellaria aurata]|nr:hypothetical protein [Pseudocyphellaria aurata]
MLRFQDSLWHVLIWITFVRLTAAATSGHFTNPPVDGSRSTYTRGDLVQITWQTDLERIALTLWHLNGTDFEYLPDSGNVVNTGSYPWQVGSSKDISKSVFYFIIYNPGDTTPAFTSTQFRIIEPPSSSTSTSASSSSASSSSASSSSASSTFVTSTSQISTAPASAQTSRSESPTAIATSSGLSAGTKTGIGVGIGIGIPLLLAVGIFIGWKFRGGRRSPEGSGDNRRGPDDMPTYVEYQPAPQELSSPRSKFMSNTNPAPHELSTSRPNELHSAPIHQME